MKRLISSINKLLAESCGYLLLLLMLMIVVDLILRYLGIVIFGIVEIGIFITVAVVYLGTGHCEEHDGHVRIDAVFTYLGPSSSAFLRCVVGIITFTIMCVASYACILSANSAFESNEAVMAGDIALYTLPVRVFIVVGLVFYCSQILISLQNDLCTFLKTLNSSVSEPTNRGN